MDDAVNPWQVGELHLGVDAAALQVVGDRARLGQEGVRLGLIAAGGGHAVGAPVVEDPRDVCDAVGPLHEPQHEVVVLASIELRLKPPELDGQRPPVDAEMTRVHQRGHVLGRPPRLWMTLDQAPVADDVLVAVDHVEVGLSGDPVGDVLEGVRREGVVVVQQGDVSPVASSSAALVAAEMPPAVSRRLRWMRGSEAACRSSAAMISGSVEPSSTRHSSQSVKV